MTFQSSASISFDAHDNNTDTSSPWSSLSSSSIDSDISQGGSSGTYIREHKRGLALHPRRIQGRHVLIGGVTWGSL